ncbi:type I 3-dehydroquinate dehydratase [Phycisphaerales bacterium AB-hyl4]|uniref:Type I 3-dehydroquinate dehydratase n=1 Tax=Natronomicrosphaera hydrolytica TaxID=3242702 RepID=A0ABV4U6X0_9BACT
MTLHFTDLPRPLLVGSLRNRTTAETIADMKSGESDGARAFILHLQLLDQPYRQPEELRKIFTATRYPMMAINYRCDGGPSDDERVNMLLQATRVGAKCIDLPADTFDLDSRKSLAGCTLPFAAADPEEISMRPECIDKQMQIIKQVHALDAQVLMSAHALNTHLDCTQAVSLATEMESRGADIVKIVTDCPTVDHALEMLRTTVELRKRLKVPFVYICTGPHGEIVRPLAPLLGSMLVFGHHDYHERANLRKQLLGNLRELYRIIPWRIDDYLE